MVDSEALRVYKMPELQDKSGAYQSGKTGRENAMGTAKLGARVRALRETKQVSRDELAERTGLAPSLLRAVEEEDLYPSLGPLLRISRALGVRLGTFLDDHAGADPLVIRLAERHEDIAMHERTGAPAATRYFSLGRGKVDRHMEPFFIELAPDAGDEALSSHEGEEFIVVHRGRVEVRYGAERRELGPGDSVYYNSVVPHRVGAAGGAKAEIYAVLYLPH
jgi:transcriptional regulator with XRE-family HTH domain